MSVNNYRPVSVLPVFSKIYEKIVYKRLYDYIVLHNILYDNQFGFREKHSSYMALITLMDHLTEALERGEAVIGLFLDFSKAFDTVDHEILLIKFHHYGIRGEMLNWFRDYLSNRTQCVLYDGVSSELLPVKCGVPQGSIWDHCYFCYMSMTYRMLQLICFLYFMLMTLTCLPLAKIWTTWYPTWTVHYLLSLIGWKLTNYQCEKDTLYGVVS